MRCRTLATVLAEMNQSCVLLGPAEIYIKDDDCRIFKDWIPMPWSSASVSDALGLAGMARAKRACGLVLDDMRVDDSYQIDLKRSGLKWLQFDDEMKKSIWADLIVNANPKVTAQDYENLTKNEDVEILAGPHYALLRKEFSNVQSRLRQRTAKTILLTFGGGDDRSAIVFCLNSLVGLFDGAIEFVVIASRNNPRNESNLQWINQNAFGRVDYQIDPTNVAAHMAQCDLAVMAGGTTTYEVNCLGLPMVILAIAENQIAQSQAWEQLGGAVFLGEFSKLEPETLASAVVAKLSQTDIHAGFTRLVDGCGALRVAEKLLRCFT